MDFVSYPFTAQKLCAAGRREGCYGTTKEQVIAALVADAKAAKLGLVLSINPMSTTPAMTPANLKSYVEYFTTNDSNYACAFTIWRWDVPDANGDGKDYFLESQNPGITSALDSILATALKHTSNVSCKYR